jgi:hypothetical protein
MHAVTDVPMLELRAPKGGDCSLDATWRRKARSREFISHYPNCSCILGIPKYREKGTRECVDAEPA